jgi:hypothetical protein
MASASDRNPLKSVAVTVAALFTSMPAMVPDRCSSTRSTSSPAWLRK